MLLPLFLSDSKWTIEGFDAPLCALAASNLLCFLSFWTQYDGLYGKTGLLPSELLTSHLRREYTHRGRFRWWAAVFWYPTHAWLPCDPDLVARAMVSTGVLCNLLLLVPGFPTPSWFLLLCSLLITISLRRLSIWSKLQQGGWYRLGTECNFLFVVGSLVVGDPTFFYRILCIRLMFGAGIVKLSSGDPAWRQGRHLDYHYWTQPLPTPLAFYANLAPMHLNRALTFASLAIEIALPGFALGPVAYRAVAFVGFGLLMFGINVTGNYSWLGLITMVPCLALLKEARLFIPNLESWHWQLVVMSIYGVISFTYVVDCFHGSLAAVRMPKHHPVLALFYGAVLRIRKFLTWYELTSQYAFFPVTTKRRYEMIFEGSNDGREWRAYDFPVKPGDCFRRPAFTFGRSYDLDLHLAISAASLPFASAVPEWFAALVRSLLEGRPGLLGLLEKNPFADHPPKFVRVQLYDYKFCGQDLEKLWKIHSSFGGGKQVAIPAATRREASVEGERDRWWERELLGTLYGPISLSLGHTDFIPLHRICQA